VTPTSSVAMRNFADALETLLQTAAEAGARRALAQIHPSQPVWIPLRQSPLGYRPTLELVRKGELQVHGIGNHKYLNREHVESWLLVHPIARASSVEHDEVEAIIEANNNRRRRRSAP